MPRHRICNSLQVASAFSHLIIAKMFLASRRKLRGFSSGWEWTSAGALNPLWLIEIPHALTGPRFSSIASDSFLGVEIPGCLSVCSFCHYPPLSSSILYYRHCPLLSAVRAISLVSAPITAFLQYLLLRVYFLISTSQILIRDGMLTSNSVNLSRVDSRLTTLNCLVFALH